MRRVLCGKERLTGATERFRNQIFKQDTPNPELTIFAQALAPIVYASSGENLHSPTPSPKPSQTGKADSCFLFWHGAGGQKTLEGEPWFVAADVCRALGLGNSSMAVSKLDDDEKMTLSLTDSHSNQRGGAQMATIINEPGLYALVLSSRKPEAKAFKRWITHEVIPSIRKTGG